MTLEMPFPVDIGLTEEHRRFALDRAINGLRDEHPMQSASRAVWGWQKPTLLTAVGFSGPDALHFYRMLFGYLHGHILTRSRKSSSDPRRQTMCCA